MLACVLPTLFLTPVLRRAFTMAAPSFVLSRLGDIEEVEDYQLEDTTQYP